MTECLREKKNQKFFLSKILKGSNSFYCVIIIKHTHKNQYIQLTIDD